MRRNVALVSVVLAAFVTFACSSGPTNAQLATNIKAKFYSSEALKNTNLQVTPNAGEVTLTGEVPSDAARYEAFKLASETPGVTKVIDQMTVQTAQVQPAAPPEETQPEPKPAPRPAHAKKVVKPVSYSPKPEPAPVAAAAPVEAAPAPAPVAAPVPAKPQEPPAPKARKVTIDAGTNLAVRMIDSVDSGVNKPGETFKASLDAPVDVEGDEIIPRGTDVTVRLAEAQEAGRVMGRGELKLELAYLDFQGKRYSLQSSDVTKVGRSEGKRSAATIGGTAAVGAIIGAIAGGGKGAAIGATAGAGAGTAAAVITKGQQVKVPSESLLEFRLQAPLTVTVWPDRAKNPHERPMNDQP